jgi:hypothetical protein
VAEDIASKFEAERGAENGGEKGLSMALIAGTQG